MRDVFGAAKAVYEHVDEDDTTADDAEVYLCRALGLMEREAEDASEYVAHLVAKHEAEKALPDKEGEQ